MRGVLFDLDGTLLDSEKLWDISLGELARRLGGVLSAQARQAMVGTNMAVTMHLLHADVGARADPADSARWVVRRTRDLYATSLVWQPGARDLLAAVRAAGLGTALVTSTDRELVEIALRTLGGGNFDAVVCGDEVTRTKPHPESYLRAAELLALRPAECLAVEDSPSGVASAEAAGCPVLAVPYHAPVGPGPGRVVRASLAGLGVADLAATHGALTAARSGVRSSDHGREAGMTTHEDQAAVRAELSDIDQTLRRLADEAGPSAPDAAEDPADAAAELTQRMERDAQIEALQRRRQALQDRLAESQARP